MKTRILTIGRNPEIANVLLRLINKNEEWEGHLALTDQEAKDIFRSSKFELVLLGSGIEESSEAHLRQYFKSIDPAIIILQHYGGGSGLLKNEINEALGK